MKGECLKSLHGVPAPKLLTITFVKLLSVKDIHLQKSASSLVLGLGVRVRAYTYKNSIIFTNYG